jgi:hypothetical protein
MADLDESEFVLMGAQGFKESVNAVAGKSEDGVDSPVDQPFDDKI